MDEAQQKRIDRIEEAFQKHVEHYMSNNKALALLSQQMKYFNEQFSEHKENEEKYQDRIDSHLEKLELIVDRLDKLDVDAAKDVVLNYKGLLSVKSVIVGLASVMIALGAIGTAVWWVFNELQSHT